MSEAATNKQTYKDLIEDQDVLDALRADKGDDVTLKCFTVRDFTRKGDNFATTVTSIVVTYFKGKEEEEEEERGGDEERLVNNDKREEEDEKLVNNDARKEEEEDEKVVDNNKSKEKGEKVVNRNREKEEDNEKVVFNNTGKEDEEERSVTYVVKCNPCRQNKAFESYTRCQFEKEGRFYGELTQPLAAILQKIGEPALRIPRCLLVKLPERREIIILEDLRSRGFEMANRNKGLNAPEAILVVKELARLHASSLIYAKETQPLEKLISKHGYLKKNRTNYDEFAAEKFKVMFSMILGNAQAVLQKVRGCEEAILWLSEVKENLLDLYRGQLADSPKFNVMCHGDCWLNNILFRYTDSGKPEEVMLLDFQMCRVASLTTDLNYFIYSSVDGSVRIKNVDSFLSTYYNTFKKVLQSGGMDVSFTLPELRQEFRAKNLLGAVTACTIVPAILMPEDEVLDYSNMKEGGLKEFMFLWRDKMLDMVDTNPLMKTWFVGLFDEFKDIGLKRV